MDGNKKPSEFDRFVGKWILKINGDTVSIEFFEGGTFNCFSKNSVYQKLFLFSEEFDQKFHLYNTPKLSPTWELKNGKLKILVSNREQNYYYDFSNNDTILTLTKTDTKESLSFTKDLSGSDVGSVVSWYLKFNVFFVFLYFLILFSLIYLVLLLGLDDIYFVVITWGLVIFVAIFMFYIWRKVILPKIKT